MTSVFSSKDVRILLGLLTVLGFILTVTTIRGAFIIDEINYMVNVTGLREGKLSVPGTGQVAPTRELFYFDPESENRVAPSTPVVSLAPPLYAPIALPFSVAGWRGLAFLNTFAFLLTAFVVFLFVRRFAVETWILWLSISLFILGGFGLEYAQGVWPHMLSVFLCTAAIYFASLAWEINASWYATLGGFLIGIACGIREQNIFLAGCLGLTLLIFGTQRLRSAASYAVGVSVPLIVSSTINYFRIGIWFPTPKAVAYTKFVAGSTHAGSWFEPFKVFWVKIVDFSSFALFQDPAQFVDYSREPSTGAFLVGGVVKKALLQSSPWVALALIVSFFIWTAMNVSREDTKRSIRALSLLLLAPLAMFALAGFRTDGLSFNQRYLLELLPLAAIIVALSIDGLSISVFQTSVGSLIAVFTFAVLLIIPSKEALHIATLDLPLLLSLGLILGWIFRKRHYSRQILAVSLGLCLGWSLSMQTIDLLASRSIRARNAVILDSLTKVIPDHSALFAYWGMQKSAAGPVQLTKDVLILDLWADAGHDAPNLARELINKNKRVFLFGTGIPPEILQSIEGNDSLTVILTKPVLIYEFLPKHPGSS